MHPYNRTISPSGSIVKSCLSAPSGENENGTDPDVSRRNDLPVDIYPGLNLYLTLFLKFVIIHKGCPIKNLKASRTSPFSKNIKDENL